MGWTFMYRAKGISNTDFFRKSVFRSTGGYHLLDTAQVGQTVYGALQVPDGTVMGVICLIKWVPNDDFVNFGYKTMEEQEGPFEAKCPERIMARLSPLSELSYVGSADKWRARVRKYHKERKAAPKVRAGGIYTWKPEANVPFPDQLVCLDGRRNLFAYIGSRYADFRIPRGWVNAEYLESVQYVDGKVWGEVT